MNAMLEIAKRFNDLLIDRLAISGEMGAFLYSVVMIAAMIAIGIGVYWIFLSIFRGFMHHSTKLKNSGWQSRLLKRNLSRNILLIIPGIVLYFIPHLIYVKGDSMIRLLHRGDLIYILIVLIMIMNSILLTFLDYYSTTDKNRKHPLKGIIQGIQVVLVFIGSIIIIAILLDKSPTVLLTGLGASAAVLMLVFKDSILGFVAGVQLSQNNMIRIGDWIQMPDGSANGNVEEITLNTVKVRNWDNTISMIPPYTLVSSPFKNWRGMQESGGRRVDKNIYIDVNSLEVCTQDMIKDIHKEFPIMAECVEDNADKILTNVQLYRLYIERYLRHHQDVNQQLDLIISQKEATPYGLPIEVYFFIKDKTWAPFEKKQSDIFDHLLTVVPDFGLKLYQRP